MRRAPSRRRFHARHRLPGALLPLAAAAALSILFFWRLTARLGPQIETVAMSRATNLISVAVGQEVDDCLTAQSLEYNDFVTLTTDDEGRVTALTANGGGRTLLRRLVVERLAARLESIDPESFSVPLGNLTGWLALSGLGPSVRVRIYSVGDVTARYRNLFESAGVNQTCHQVWLDLTVTVYLLIPGKIIPITASESVCVAETVIVGQVPDTYLNLLKGEQ